MRLDELVLKISTMLKTAAPEASYEKIKGRMSDFEESRFWVVEKNLLGG